MTWWMAVALAVIGAAGAGSFVVLMAFLVDCAAEARRQRRLRAELERRLGVWR